MTEQTAMLDITGADDVEVQIKSDGMVLWVNLAHGCVLRICRIKGAINVIDYRTGPQRPEWEP